jgi:hypothetical protein
MAPEELWAKRRERARRWTGSDLPGDPTLAAEEETVETLAAEPPKKEDRRRCRARGIYCQRWWKLLD